MRCGGFYLRCISILYAIILDGLVIVDDMHPLPEDLEVMKFLRKHMMYHFKGYNSAYSNPAKPNQKMRARQLLENAWDDFQYWWNGSLASEHMYFHYIKLSSEKPNKETIAGGMARSFVRLVFRALPGTPEDGKWTKTPPAFDFFVMLAVPAGIITVLLDFAASKVNISIGEL